MRDRGRIGSGSNQGTRWRRPLGHGALCFAAIGALALLATACSSGGSATSTSSSPSSSTGSAGTTAVVKVVTVPTYGQILTDSSGMPLYTLSGTCTGSCASAWPALTVPAGTNPTGGAGVSGALSTMQAGGSHQVTYNGSPLYTFVQDSSDHVTGQGVAGFSVVKVSKSATSKSSTSTTSGGGYGY
jgi:predicted lipoprotein with Yx(FWY)xxD motif